MLPGAIEAKPKLKHEETLQTKTVLNWSLFAAESAGALMILWHGVPIYRRLLMGLSGRGVEASVVFWVCTATSLIQVGYWVRLGCFPLPRLNRQQVLGHAIQFIGRLSFMFIGGMFSVVFFARFHELEFSV